ncbi:LacI family transcriptional regulator [Saccharopolyspora karakumensis]|uniref:LacI family transcriptional regulator n=1 Tax=Saccharopolyspora karakumensis TaxID=2530386 RepID=A0A4R5BLU0_9PSEU|nr:LacI family DNA-binding transcriptional regulator [Saccharopolyspora karakumensis]TDD87748.1 LacI family transcriptional regulator [Saccharopolyspora karakumensis]
MKSSNHGRKTGVRALRVSAADVAREAGVTPATVSYVFNGRGGVSAEMRQRVLQIAREMGYPLERHRSKLDADRTRVLGLVLAHIDNPFYADVAAGTIDAARGQGYEVFLAHTQESPETLASVVEAMIARRVDGIVLTVLHPDDGGIVRRLRRARMPFVQLIRRIPDLHADFIGINDVMAAEEIVRHVVEHGYTDLAVVTGPHNSSSSGSRAEAFVATAQRLGTPVPPHRRFTTSLTAEGGNHAAQHLIETGDVPRAIVCGSDAIASGVIGSLRGSGIRIPEDVAVTGIDGVFPAASMLAELTTICVPRRHMAELAVDQLIRRIDGAGGPTRESIRPYELHIGTTCGCPPRAISPVTGEHVRIT